MSKLIRYLGGPLVLISMISLLITPLSISAAPLSGHVTIGLTANPSRAVVGEETRLVITLKGKDQQPVAGAAVQVSAEMIMAQGNMAGMNHGNMAGAQSSKGQISLTAKPSDKPGEYVAMLKLTDEGEWTITVASGDSAAQLKLIALKAPANAAKPAAANAPVAKLGKGAPVKLASASAKASSMEAIHASYLELTGNITDLRSRVDQWKKGDEDSLKIAGEKIERIEVVLGSVIWPAVMAKAVMTTTNAVAPMARALNEKSLAAAEPAAKALGDGSHDVTHAFYGDWLPSVEGTRYSPMAPHAIYLDLSANIADLRNRVGQWEKGDESSLNIAKEKAERIGVLIPHMTPYGVMLKPLQVLDKALPNVVAALEKKNVSAAQEALKPIAEASHDLTHDFYQWMGIAGGGNDMACVPASYRDLTLNITDLRGRVEQWKMGDEDSYKIAGEKLERIEAVLAHPTWPAEMAKSVEKSEAAVKSMAQALKDKDLGAAEAAAKALGDGSHDVTHDYFGTWLPNVQLGADEGQVATAQGKRVTAGHGDGHGGTQADPNGPNWLVVGSFVGIMALVVVTAAVMKRSMIAAAQARANHGEELA